MGGSFAGRRPGQCRAVTKGAETPDVGSESAFREGYHSRKEDMLNSTVAKELRHMLGGVSFGEVMQQLVRA